MTSILDILVHGGDIHFDNVLPLGVQTDRIRYEYGCYHIRIRFRSVDTAMDMDIIRIEKLHIHILKKRIRIWNE